MSMLGEYEHSSSKNKVLVGKNMAIFLKIAQVIMITFQKIM
jgi:hypothetical protein